MKHLYLLHKHGHFIDFIGTVIRLKVTNVNIGYDHRLLGHKLENAYAWNEPNVGSYPGGCSATPLAALPPAPDDFRDSEYIWRHAIPNDPKVV